MFLSFYSTIIFISGNLGSPNPSFMLMGVFNVQRCKKQCYRISLDRRQASGRYAFLSRWFCSTFPKVDSLPSNIIILWIQFHPYKSTACIDASDPRRPASHKRIHHRRTRLAEYFYQVLHQMHWLHGDVRVELALLCFARLIHQEILVIQFVDWFRRDNIGGHFVSVQPDLI